MLRPGDYIGAASRLLWGTTKLIWAFLWRMFFAVPIVLAAAGYGIDVLLTSHTVAAGKVVGSLAAMAAALGFSWTSIRSQLFQLATKLEQPLWNAELDAAMGAALTILRRNAVNRWIVDRPGLVARMSPAGPPTPNQTPQS